MMFDDDDDDDNNDDDRWIIPKRNSRSGGRSDSRYSEANKKYFTCSFEYLGKIFVRFPSLPDTTHLRWQYPKTRTRWDLSHMPFSSIALTWLRDNRPVCWPRKTKKRKRNPRKISHDWPHRQGNPSPPTPQDTNPVWGRQCPTEVRHSESDWACRRAQATFSRHPLAQSNLNDGRPRVVLTPMVLLLGDHPGIGRLWQEWLNNVRKSSNTGSCKDRGYLR